MTDYLVVAIAGFLACMVDGSLGMGFGPTSSTIMLGSGLSPVSVSATVNLAKVLTGIAGGLSHLRFGNVDRRLAWRLALPGVLGAFIGVTLLRNVSDSILEPVLSVILMLAGIRILLLMTKSGGSVRSGEIPSEKFGNKGVAIAGLAGGVTNGLVGTWGPVVTPALIHKGIQARFVVGSVNAAEVAVAAVSVGSLVPVIRGGGVNGGELLAMIIGGVIAAPMAALMVRRLPQRGMILGVAGLLLITNLRTLSNWASLGWIRWLAYSSVGVVLLFAWFRSGVRIGTRRNAS